MYIEDREKYFEYLRKQRLEKIERNFPEELKSQNGWAVFRTRKETDEKTGETKVKKFILDAKTGHWANSADSSSWSSFSDAKDGAMRLKATGLSFQLKDSPYTVIDLDGVFVNGEYSQLAQEIMNLTDGTLMERSVSGTGVHIFLKGKKDFLMPGYKTKGEGGLEVFDNKFISVTGDLLPTSTKAIKEPSYELVELLKERLGKSVENAANNNRTTLRNRSDETVLRRAENSDKVGKDFKALYFDGDTSRYGGDHSRADFRLCGILACFCGNDEGQVKRLFEGSALYRAEKGDDYVTRTVRKACSTNYSGSGK